MGDAWRLVTWSKDQTLRYWRVDADIQARCTNSETSVEGEKEEETDEECDQRMVTMSPKGAKGGGGETDGDVSEGKSLLKTSRKSVESSAAPKTFNDAIIREYASVEESKFKVLDASSDKAFFKVCIASNAVRSIK